MVASNMFSWQSSCGNSAGQRCPCVLLPSYRLWGEWASLSCFRVWGEPQQGHQSWCGGPVHSFLQGSTVHDAAVPSKSSTSKARCSWREDWHQHLRCCWVRAWNVLLQYTRLLQTASHSPPFPKRLKKSSHACSLWFTCWKAFVDSQERETRSLEQGLLSQKKKLPLGEAKL